MPAARRRSSFWRRDGEDVGVIVGSGAHGTHTRERRPVTAAQATSILLIFRRRSPLGVANDDLVAELAADERLADR